MLTLTISECLFEGSSTFVLRCFSDVTVYTFDGPCVEGVTLFRARMGTEFLAGMGFVRCRLHLFGA